MPGYPSRRNPVTQRQYGPVNRLQFGYDVTLQVSWRDSRTLKGLGIRCPRDAPLPALCSACFVGRALNLS